MTEEPNKFDMAINMLNSKISVLESRMRDISRKIEEIMMRMQFMETGGLPTQNPR